MTDDSPHFVALAELRRLGWSVAVHNDYSLRGERMTFWLFTRSDADGGTRGRFVKGEGTTDRQALEAALEAARRDADLGPPDDDVLRATVAAFASRTNRRLAATVPTGSPLRWQDVDEAEKRGQIDDMRAAIFALRATEGATE